MTLTIKHQTFAACVVALQEWQHATAPGGLLSKKIERALLDLKAAERTAVDFDLAHAEPPVTV